MFCGDENILYHDGINSSILDMILYYGFARYYHWGKLVYMESVYQTNK